MAGHSARYGDRFSLVQAAKSSGNKGSKAQYYPISSRSSVISEHNPHRPKYSLNKLPIRNQGDYWNTIRELDSTQNKTQMAAITKATGVVRMPLCAASPAFIHPTFFPLDPFHLFYENCMAFLWDLWTTSPVDDVVHLPNTKAEKFGKWLENAMVSLPPAFCGPIRDIHLKRQSQYKIYEWMGLLHWYLIPFGIELGFESRVLDNTAQFVGIIEFAMTIKPRSKADLDQLSKKVVEFLTGYEKLYIENDSQKFSRARLCIFQLIHVPHHMRWNGSIRLGSQATMERTIGISGHNIHSKKAPFVNLANGIYKGEQIKILCLYYPELDSEEPTPVLSPAAIKPIKPWRSVSKAKRQNRNAYNSNLDQELGAIYSWLGADSLLEAIEGGQLIFGEALAFYELQEPKQELVVVYHSLGSVKSTLGCITGIWLPQISVLPVRKIINIVGVWTGPTTKRVYILRKHPGLQYLNTEECGKFDVIGQEEFEDLD
ncbi:hypothetical protein BD779DRAFT_1447804 [Infundibulicybe gibba]|nr:hypothetical protein BD779DRAFT_1447804 [Infundibulicybe gibba]